MTWTAPPGWQKLRRAVFQRYGRQCWRCGRPAGTIDHVLPQVLGGSDDISNLRPACAHCNYSTGASLGNRLRGGRVYQPWSTARRW
jgi:5-methylcytosine-specific restriction endonuclease McrA